MIKLFKSSPASEAWLLVGLGNPGDQYAKNRHNIGFMIADALAQENHFPAFKSKFQGHLAEGAIAGQKIILLKPQTFMNLSGQSVQAAAKFYKVAPERIIAFHDELDLPAFKVKVKKGGGNAGHNGLKSLDAHLGTPDYWRVRLGIGHPGEREKVHGYVLGDFAKAEQAPLERFIDAVVKNTPALLSGRDAEFMTTVARETN